MEWYERTDSIHPAGVGSDGMSAQGTIHNTGSPSGDRGVDQLAARERKAGPCWGDGEARRTDEAG